MSLLLEGNQANRSFDSQCGAIGKKTANEQPGYLKNTHPWTSDTGSKGRITPLLAKHCNVGKSFVSNVKGVPRRDNHTRTQFSGGAGIYSDYW